MEQFGGPVRDHGGDGGVTHSGLKYRLLSPASSIVDEDEVIVDNRSIILPSSIAAPLIWDYARGFWGHEGPPTLLGCNGHHRIRGLHSGV
jgi:hypothetical protein